MTDYDPSIITASDATGYARAAQEQAATKFLFASFLPEKPEFDLDYVFTQGGRKLVEAASYRAYDTAPTKGISEGAPQVRGQLPPISREVRIGEYERLRMRSNGTDELEQRLLDECARLAVATEVRLELARSEALVNGKLELDENGLHASIDYRRNPANAVVPATAWTDTSATALTDILNWSDAYVDINGTMPGTLVTSRRVQTLLATNREMISASGAVSEVTRITLDALNQVLASEGLPSITTYDTVVAGADGNPTRIMPEDEFLMLPTRPMTGLADPGVDPGVLGSTPMGPPAEALEPEYGIGEADAAGLFAGIFRNTGPEGRWARVSAIAVPVVENPNATMVAEVL